MSEAPAETDLVARPEELVFEAVYAPLDPDQLLASADSRSRIRRLPAPQLYYSLHSAEDRQLERLLPHITEEQWETLLDLDIWDRDETSSGRILRWTRLLAGAEDAVARKLLRATDPDLIQLLFSAELEIYARTEDDEFEGEPAEGRSWATTPDGQFLLVLPEHPEKERLLRGLIERLSALDADGLSLNLAQSRARTSIEMQESAFQRRRSRLEDLGFQDYFDAIEIFTPWPADEPLPDKSWSEPEAVSTLPLRLGPTEGTRWLLLEALGAVDDSIRPRLLEELFYTCNKLLSARRVSTADGERVKQGIREALVTVNLGLDVWSGSDLTRAAEGLRRHFVVSFYQYGRGRLLDLQEAARRSRTATPPEEGSPQEAFLEAILGDPPRRIEVEKGKLVVTDFATADDVEAASARL